MNRKKFIKIGALAGMALGLSNCEPSIKKNISKGRFEQEYYWKMLTTWPPNFPILGEACTQFANNVNVMSGGRMKIKVFGAGELVPAMESFEAVSIGVAEIASGAAYYWAGKVPAAQFFAAVPFGMNAQMLNSWFIADEGMQLWREAYSEHNLVPLLGGNTGMQMGGWFNKEISTIDDLKGLKIRMPGLGGKILTRAGGSSVLVAGGEIYTNLERGVIDATEWLGPYHDYLMGFHEIAKYYYTPGWHETGTSLEYIINKDKLSQLPKDLQEIIKAAANISNSWILAQFEMKNALYLEKILKNENVAIRKWPKKVLNQLKELSLEVLEEEANRDTMSKKVYASYMKFLNQAKEWSLLSEKVYFDFLN